MSRARSQLRNLTVAALLALLVLTFAIQGRSADASQSNIPLKQAIDFVWTPQTGTFTVAPNGTFTFNTTLDNNGPAGVFDITVPTLPAGWAAPTISPGTPVSIPANGTVGFSFVFTVPNNTATGSYSISIVARRQATGAQASAVLTVSVTPSTATPTVTSTPTATTGAVSTATATPVGCPDSPDPGGDIGSAKQLLVDISERHGICSAGDEDWFKFGAVGGKVYTIDILQMDTGLDLSLELFDANGNRLTFNDDYFNRTGTPTPTDIKPQIHSWRAPQDGLYYIRVRDNLNLGGNNRSYAIVVNSESYGPTPAQVTEICRDMFEEDGLPEQARLITSNELQRAHVLCPAGDADWVKFFGLKGKTYYIYTDTRGYKNNPDINNQTEAGADTVIYLADRDGVSIIDFNDDIGRDKSLTDLGEPLTSLDSALRFTPSADGFYYLQIKNVGDIGNQFIKYDLTLKLCLPDQRCVREGVAAAQPTAAQPTAASGTTSTPTPTVTPTTGAASFLQNSLKPGPLVNGPLRGFADPAFNRVWQRTDKPIAEQRIARSWIWGPQGLMARTEGYIQSASGLRQVQYFDKARMEVNNPRGDRNSRWFVTTGLLVVELISGRTQIGDNEFVQHAPADIPIAGDQGDPNAPTYTSFGGVTGLQPGDRTGQSPAEAIDRAGQVSAYAGPQRPETQLAHFVAESGHNIPQVFWQYLNAGGLVFDNNRYRSDTVLDWVFTLGYPISEPYWTRIKVGGVDRDVLVQAFQRRVLTYSPDNPSGWQVEMGNVGRHYYAWRYGEDLP